MCIGHTGGTLSVMPERSRKGKAEVIFGNSELGFIVEDVQQGWHVQAWLELRDGAPRITELRLRPAGGSTIAAAHGVLGPRPDYTHEMGRKIPKGGITSEVLRGLSLSALHDSLGTDNGSAEMLALHGLDPDTDFLASRRPGRRGRSDYFYAVWAELYVDKCKATRHPHAELVREYPDVDERASQHRIRVAGKGEALVGRASGRAGGQLSAKAKRLLERGDAQ